MSKPASATLSLTDAGPTDAALLREVIAGLSRTRKILPAKLFYDERGSKLFDQICELPEYYPTRTELAIMEEHAGDMAACIGERAMVIEYGAGSSVKIRLLLDALDDPVACVPIDISGEHLEAAVRQLAQQFPKIEMLPVVADYSRSFELPTPSRAPASRVVYFPGSTLGNFHRKAARRFLAQLATVCGDGGGLLIGVDAKKDPQRLHAAYNDSQGVTAQFNLNMLVRLNAQFAADFALDQWRHYACYNPRRGRMEMHLLSLRRQSVSIADRTVAFDRGESIRTECSYKYNLDEFVALADAFELKQVWTDEEELFRVMYLTVK